MYRLRPVVRFRLMRSFAMLLMTAVIVGMAVTVWASTTSFTWDSKEDFERNTNRINIDTTTREGWVKIGLPKDLLSGGEITCATSDRIYSIGADRASIAVINVETKALLQTIPLPVRASGIVFNSHDNKIYVGNYSTATVSVIDGSTLSIVKTIDVGNGAYAAAYNSRNNKVYVANASDSTVSVIDGVSDNVIATVPVVAAPSTAVYNALKNEIYVTNKYNHTVSIIDGASDQVVSAVSIEPAAGIIGGQDAANRGLLVDTQALGVGNCDKIRLLWAYDPLQASQKIQFQVRSGDDLATLPEYTGPDGTNASWYETPADGSVNASVDLDITLKRYLELQVKLSSDETASPALDKATVEFLSYPDLIMTSVSGPGTGLIGKSINLSSTVVNQGTEAAGPFKVGYYATDVNGAGSQYLICDSAVPALGPAASDSNVITCTIPASVPPGNYYLQAVADYAQQVTEGNENNNSVLGNSISITQPYPDLTITDFSGPSTGIVGGNITVSTTVGNQGDDSAGTFKVGIYLVDGAGVEKFVCDRTISSLPERGSDQATQICTVPAVPTGDYHLRAVADYTSAIRESNEDNNTVDLSAPTTISSTPADLVVKSVTGTVSGGKLTYTVVVKNQGTTSTGGFYTGIYLSPDTTITTGDRFVTFYSTTTGVAGGATVTLSGTADVPVNYPGTYYVGAYVDSNHNVVGTSTPDNIAEYEENNNTLAGTQVTITNDLSIDSVVGSVANGKLTYTVEVRNNGIGQSGPFYSGIYLSPDTAITTADAYVTYYSTTTGVAGGSTVTLTGSPNVPTGLTSGAAYYVGAYADSNYNVVGTSGPDKVVETDEGNNTLAGNTVTAP